MLIMRKKSPKSYEYIDQLLISETPEMSQARKQSENLGLDSISISSTEAHVIKFHLLGIQARKVIEIGTLTGLSALHILAVLPTDGLLISFEKSREHADLAAAVLKTEIQTGRCRIITGDAREKLSGVNSEGPFDAVFIDGNKAAYLDYYNWALENTRSGGLIFVDNIFLAGAVWGDETKQSFNPKQIDVVRRMNLKAFSDQNLSSVIIPTEEGLLITRKKSQ